MLLTLQKLLLRAAEQMLSILCLMLCQLCSLPTLDDSALLQLGHPSARSPYAISIADLQSSALNLEGAASNEQQALSRSICTMRLCSTTGNWQAMRSAPPFFTSLLQSCTKNLDLSLNYTRKMTKRQSLLQGPEGHHYKINSTARAVLACGMPILEYCAGSDLFMLPLERLLCSCRNGSSLCCQVINTPLGSSQICVLYLLLLKQLVESCLHAHSLMAARRQIRQRHLECLFRSLRFLHCLSAALQQSGWLFSCLACVLQASLSCPMLTTCVPGVFHAVLAEATAHGSSHQCCCDCIMRLGRTITKINTNHTFCLELSAWSICFCRAAMSEPIWSSCWDATCI